MTQKESKAFESLEALDRQAMLIGHISAVLGYDFETVMSKKGGEERAKQLSFLSSLDHDIASGEKMRELLEELSSLNSCIDSLPDGSANSATDEQKALVRVRKKEYERASSLPQKLVEDLSEASNSCQNQWFESRKTGDFKAFEPYLERLVDLVKEEATLTSKGRSLYDTLLDKYDMGFNASQIETLFNGMEVTIKDVIREVKNSSIGSNEKQLEKESAFLYEPYDIEKQKAFSKKVLEDMGFDFERGSIGEVAHPFTSTVGCDDIRITTRYEDPNVTSQLLTIVHEGGHAIYEMGANSGWIKGTILGQGVNMAFHESQSRLWENLVARSPQFWEHYFPIFCDFFPSQTKGVKFETFLRAVNNVKVDDIRCNADEVTYGLHVILRFRLEKELFDGNLKVKDLPGAWDDMSFELLGKRPNSLQSGVLQDVHWPGGMFGYFPAYALGNLINAHVWHFMEKDIDVNEAMRSGNLVEIKDYLTQKYYKYGAVYPANELIVRGTGKELDASYFDKYLRDKYKALFS